MPPEPEVEVVAEATLVPVAPSTPPVPVTESDNFLAVLRAFRDEAARGS